MNYYSSSPAPRVLEAPTSPLAPVQGHPCERVARHNYDKNRPSTGCGPEARRLGGVRPRQGGGRPRVGKALPRPGGFVPRQVIPLGGFWRSYPWAVSGGHTPGRSLEVIPLGTSWRSYPWASSGGHTPGHSLEVIPLSGRGGPLVDGFPLRIPEDRANALSFVVCICPKIALSAILQCVPTRPPPA